MSDQTIHESGSKGTSRLLKIGITLSIALMLMFAVRSAVAEVYVVPVGSMEPELPRGSRVLVLKVGEDFSEGRILAYRLNAGSVLLGRVVEFDCANNVVTVSRNGTQPEIVDVEDVIGRVVVNTR
jgi:hypothetical protein